MKTEYSRHELYAMGEPFGAGATRVKPGGRGRIYGGGGGEGVKYENLDKLYEMQATQAGKLMEMSDKYVYPAFGQMMEESKGIGSIENQELAATQAGADSQAAIGQAKQQMNEELSSMGVDPSDPRYANTLASLELQGAANTAASQTGARDRTKQLGYAKMKDAVSMGMGLPSDATSALNSAGQMASSSANVQSQMAATRAQNTGNIAALAGRFLFADGGEVKSPNRLAVGGMIKKQCYADGGQVKRPQGLALGGQPRAGFLASMPTAAPPPTAPTQSKGAALGNAAIGTGGVKGGAIIEKVGEWTGSSGVQAFGQGLRLGKDAQPAIDAYKAASAAPTSVAPVATDAAATAAADAAGTAAAGAEAAGAAATGAAEAGAAAATAAEAGATAAAAGEAAGVAGALGAGSAVAAALPWVGGAMLIGSALGLFADGGSVNKKRLAVANGIKGGPVSGPGGPKDDLVPAMLSDGEFVMPVGTVELYGKDVLEKMRQDGLAHEKQIGIGA